MSQRTLAKSVLLFQLVLLVLDRVQILKSFAARYIDSDTVLFWFGAHEYAEGIFREPFLYGQDYNYMLEALFAVPLLWAGVDVAMAMPIVSLVLAAFPFLMLVHHFVRSEGWLAANAVITVLLLLPNEYVMMTSQARGLVSGLFAAGLICHTMLQPPTKWREVWNGFGTGLAIALSPNALLLLLPLWVWRVWRYHKALLPSWWALLLGAALPLAMHGFAFWFVHQQPGLVVHPAWKLMFDVQRISEAAAHLQDFFLGLMPIFWNDAYLVPIALAALAAVLWVRKQRGAALALLATLVALIVSLGINKIHDGRGWLFFSQARMFLALPVVFALGAAWWISSVQHSKIVSYALAACALLGCMARWQSVERDVQVAVVEPPRPPVEVMEIDRLRSTCKALSEAARQHNATAVVGLHTTKDLYLRGEIEFYTYGCPCLENGFPPTVYRYDRKYWERTAATERIDENIVFVGGRKAHFTQYSGSGSLTQLGSNPNVFLLSGNTRPTAAALQELAKY